MKTNKTILITGCSSGIGYDSAIALTRRGHRVIASCRKQEDVNHLLALGIETLLIDVADKPSVDQGFAQFLSITNGRIDALINNAGYGQAGALEDVPHDALYQQFATNVFGLMAITRLAIPIMRQQNSGRIINISSLLGLISLPFRGAYNASKYAVEGLSDTLRLELQSSGIAVITIEPGPINSRFRDNVVDHSLKKIDIEHSHFKQQYQRMLNEFKQKKSDSLFTLNTNAVIKALIHAIESNHPKIKYPITFPTWLFIVLKRLVTTHLLDKLLLAVSKKELGPVDN